jgi:flagellin-specific chaperone FliS
MQTRLMEANSQQSDVPLKEVERLLQTLLEGWRQVSSLTPEADESLHKGGFTY